ncbi:hypothetical protein L210DRAFT_726498 [Boletus edulis BED1]|uniref:Uncharacterized protein n=1 Tax=Boletus edulis BED1 TaxID=1328754 RepID=A0AAD4GGW4_BOLED|nr:hypothetical protein L210DRAFT_726498 [Boletus edulis BED1]
MTLGLLDICTEERPLGIDVERTSVRPVIDERLLLVSTGQASPTVCIHFRANPSYTYPRWPPPKNRVGSNTMTEHSQYRRLNTHEGPPNPSTSVLTMPSSCASTLTSALTTYDQRPLVLISCKSWALFGVRSPTTTTRPSSGMVAMRSLVIETPWLAGRDPACSS